MRIFIALELPDKTRENLSRSAGQLKELAISGNFVPPQNYHVTLHFLGEVAESDLIYVQSAMDGVRDMPAPLLSLQQVVTMRGSDAVCARIKQDGALTLLHDKLGELLEKNGFDVEHKAYRPHVTVARRYRSTLPFSEVTKSVDVFNKAFYGTEAVLFESVLRKGAPQYVELYRISLPLPKQH